MSEELGPDLKADFMCSLPFAFHRYRNVDTSDFGIVALGSKVQSTEAVILCQISDLSPSLPPSLPPSLSLPPDILSEVILQRRGCGSKH